MTVVRLVGAPGSGKTALLEATSRILEPELRIAVLAADLVGDHDAAHLREAGTAAIGVTTGTVSHLDADLVHRALRAVAWRELDYLFIEDIGNLVCPAVYDLGQSVNVLTLSVPEGADQPLKYPTIFRKADVVVLTKFDLPLVERDQMERLRRNLAAVVPHPLLLETSVRDGTGLAQWARWLRGFEHRRGASRALGPMRV